MFSDADKKIILALYKPCFLGYLFGFLIGLPFLIPTAAWWGVQIGLISFLAFMPPIIIWLCRKFGMKRE